ncbi:hypothetical protein GQ457_18G012960 [Hibiscus cannabinus]
MRDGQFRFVVEDGLGTEAVKLGRIVAVCCETTMPFDVVNKLSRVASLEGIEMKGLFSNMRAAGVWFRERNGLEAFKAKSCFVVENWVEAGGGFGAARAKIWKTEAVRSTSMVVVSKSSKVFTYSGFKEMVSKGMVSLTFQSSWLPIHANISDYKLSHRRFAEIWGILSIMLLVTLKILDTFFMSWLKIEIYVTWLFIMVGTTYWLFGGMLFLRNGCGLVVANMLSVDLHCFAFEDVDCSFSADDSKESHLQSL